MRKILEIWQQFQNRILATVKENNAEKAVSNVLGVQVGNVGNPYKPETLNVAKLVQNFKKGLKRFAGQEDKYNIFQKHFLENVLSSPFQTLRLENITPEGVTFLPLGRGILEDLKVRDRLGPNANHKSFKQVAKEQKLGWWSKAKIWWVITAIIIAPLLAWAFHLHGWTKSSKEFAGTVESLIITFVAIWPMGIYTSFKERSKKRKQLLADFKIAQNYPYLDNYQNERRAIFHNGTDSQNHHSSAFEKDYGRSIICNFLDFKDPASKDFDAKKEMIKKAAELAIGMQGRLFYLIGEASECYYEFGSKSQQYTLGFYIAEIGIEVDDMVLFLKDWPASSTSIPDTVILGHAEKKFQEEGLNLFTLSPDF